MCLALLLLHACAQVTMVKKGSAETERRANLKPYNKGWHTQPTFCTENSILAAISTNTLATQLVSAGAPITSPGAIGNSTDKCLNAMGLSSDSVRKLQLIKLLWNRTKKQNAVVSHAGVGSAGVPSAHANMVQQPCMYQQVLQSVCTPTWVLRACVQTVVLIHHTRSVVDCHSFTRPVPQASQLRYAILDHLRRRALCLLPCHLLLLQKRARDIAKREAAAMQDGEIEQWCLVHDVTIEDIWACPTETAITKQVGSSHTAACFAGLNMVRLARTWCSILLGQQTPDTPKALHVYAGHLTDLCLLVLETVSCWHLPADPDPLQVGIHVDWGHQATHQ